jgi:hypothetical protein
LKKFILIFLFPAIVFSQTHSTKSGYYVSTQDSVTAFVAKYLGFDTTARKVLIWKFFAVDTSGNVNGVSGTWTGNTTTDSIRSRGTNFTKLTNFTTGTTIDSFKVVVDSLQIWIGGNVYLAKKRGF